MKKLIMALGLLGLTTSLCANASLLNDVVSAQIESIPGVVINQQFASPVNVGSGQEFTGLFQDSVGHQWTVGVDFGADNFVVTFNSALEWANIHTSDNNQTVFQMNFTDWNPSQVIESVVLSDYSCVSQFPCMVRNLVGEANVNLFSFTDHGIRLGFNGLYNSEAYTFSINKGVQVPEPSSYILLLLGLMALVARATSRRAK